VDRREAVLGGTAVLVRAWRTATADRVSILAAIHSIVEHRGRIVGTIVVLLLGLLLLLIVGWDRGGTLLGRLLLCSGGWGSLLWG